jgi:hypothetical protein
MSSGFTFPVLAGLSIHAVRAPSPDYLVSTIHNFSFRFAVDCTAEERYVVAGLYPMPRDLVRVDLCSSRLWMG